MEEENVNEELQEMYNSLSEVGLCMQHIDSGHCSFQ
jgi:hypothetical protein